MINKENNDKEHTNVNKPSKEDSFVDTAKMDVQCHLIIKDKETREILVNKRG